MHWSKHRLSFLRPTQILAAAVGLANVLRVSVVCEILFANRAPDHGCVQGGASKGAGRMNATTCAGDPFNQCAQIVNINTIHTSELRPHPKSCHFVSYSHSHSTCSHSFLFFLVADGTTHTQVKATVGGSGIRGF